MRADLLPAPIIVGEICTSCGRQWLAQGPPPRSASSRRAWTFALKDPRVAWPIGVGVVQVTCGACAGGRRARVTPPIRALRWQPPGMFGLGQSPGLGASAADVALYASPPMILWNFSPLVLAGRAAFWAGSGVANATYDWARSKGWVGSKPSLEKYARDTERWRLDFTTAYNSCVTGGRDGVSAARGSAQCAVTAGNAAGRAPQLPDGIVINEAALVRLGPDVMRVFAVDAPRPAWRVETYIFCTRDSVAAEMGALYARIEAEGWKVASSSVSVHEGEDEMQLFGGALPELLPSFKKTSVSVFKPTGNREDLNQLTGDPAEAARVVWKASIGPYLDGSATVRVVSAWWGERKMETIKVVQVGADGVRKTAEVVAAVADAAVGVAKDPGKLLNWGPYLFGGLAVIGGAYFFGQMAIAGGSEYARGKGRKLAQDFLAAEDERTAPSEPRRNPPRRRR